ncbi:MFS transporter [Nonomuraea sp. B12E4]|uniref:MFS transporter n=1 Tax=Nonomuraea sp. B12E4 TaxID=3153564 RepID=UPI00325CD1C5
MPGHPHRPWSGTGDAGPSAGEPLSSPSRCGVDNSPDPDYAGQEAEGAPVTDKEIASVRTPQPAWVMLGVATFGFAVNFWAWALLSPLGPRLKELLGLSAAQQALLVAVPVIVGSLGRIPVGALTDRFGGRVMFPLISAATIVPVLFIGVAGQTRSYGSPRRYLLTFTSLLRPALWTTNASTAIARDPVSQPAGEPPLPGRW